MPHNRLRHALRLRPGRAQPLQDLQREQAAVELKRQQRGGDVRVRGAEVVQEAG